MKVILLAVMTSALVPDSGARGVVRRALGADDIFDLRHDAVRVAAPSAVKGPPFEPQAGTRTEDTDI